MCHVEIVRVEHLPALVPLLNEFYTLTAEVLEHQLFANPGQWRLAASGVFPGVVLVDAQGGLQGFMAAYPMELHADQQPVAGCHWGVLYVREAYRSYLMDMMQYMLDESTASVIYTNTSNANSIRVCKALRFRLAEVAYRYKYFNILAPVGLLRLALSERASWLLPLTVLLKPVDWLWCLTLPRCRRGAAGVEYRRLSGIDPGLFGVFNQALIAANRGMLSSRDPAYLEWLFGSRLASGEFVLLGGFEADQLRGYILLQREKSGGGYSRVRVADWVAVGADPALLEGLLDAAQVFALRNGMAELHVNGFPEVAAPLLARAFRFRVRKKGVPCAYFLRDRQLRQDFAARMDESWFFSPYDGDALF